ncbi:hypothetical protein Y032_0843g2645 [Ancylostoma ceylanicum]|uniref:Uncharacterized protein n=1 Tax=Ancylostoma ceylanicum TaxID=53326 RepID=A0A016WCB4_9BILA|nr:hypothetical protein Y032_0843g2645 [Ancylostoma ceylanicum]
MKTLSICPRTFDSPYCKAKTAALPYIALSVFFGKQWQVVPFRLTRNMVNGFGPTGVEGSFRRSCESTLRVMRENKDTLLTVIQTFVHDPLLEWINTEARAQQNKGRGQQKLNAPSTESVQLILKRLEGHIVSPEVYKHKFSCAPMSLEGQVAKLIDIASDEKNLAQMYIGWGPFI